MKGGGIFKNKIKENDKNVSKALDQIPLSGQITKRHYDNFIKYFTQTFTGNYIATATRRRDTNDRDESHRQRQYRSSVTPACYAVFGYGTKSPTQALCYDETVTCRPALAPATHHIYTHRPR